MTKIVPCGGCGEVDETKRCVGCLHNFHPEEVVPNKSVDNMARRGWRTQLMHAATSCPHEIDKDKVLLHFDPKQEGHNALSQLANRLAQVNSDPELVPNELESLKAATNAIYFADSSDYLSALWTVVRALSPQIAALLEAGGNAAYERVNELQSIAEQNTIMVAVRRPGIATLEALTSQVEHLTKERDEADRRAGAAERRQASTSDTLFKLNHWRDKQKVMAGYNPNVSFDIVWDETLEKARKTEEASRLLKMVVEEQRLRGVFYPAHNAALKFLGMECEDEGCPHYGTPPSHQGEEG